MSKVAIVVVIGILLLGGIFFAQDALTPESQKQSVAVPTQADGNLEFQTFSVDELGEPLVEANLSEAVSRNETRIEDVDEQIDEDLLFLTELNESLNDVAEEGISE